jgi:hypothetical protein
MNKINLEELLKVTYLSRNETILKMYRDEKDEIRLCTDGHYIVIEEDLETALKCSDIDLLIGNEELYILTQYNKFYKVKGHIDYSGSQNIQLIDFNTLEPITYSKPNVYLETLDGVTFDCKPTVDDVVEAIIEEHERHDVIIGENLESLKIHGLTIPEVVRVYAILYGKFEEDRVIRIAEGEEIDLRY